MNRKIIESQKVFFYIGIICFLLFFPFTILLAYLDSIGQLEGALPILNVVGNIISWSYLFCALYLWVFSFKDVLALKNEGFNKFLFMLAVSIFLIGIYGFFHYYYKVKKEKKLT